MREAAAGRNDGDALGRGNAHFLILFSLVLFGFCLATRIPFRSSYLSGWDPVQFALAIHHFDPRLHQPQPPGYIVIVGLAKLLTRFLRNDTLTLTTLAALFSALSAVLVFLLAYWMFDRRTALLASIVWATCPLVWFHGLVGEIYTAAGFASLATALSVFAFLKAPSRLSAVSAGVVYALAAGLRPDQLLLLAPLFLFPFWRSAKCRVWAVYAAVPALLGCAAWYTPTLAFSGGYGHYSQLLRDQFSGEVGTGSVLFGASPLVHVFMLTLLLSGLTLGILPLLFLLPLLWTHDRLSAPLRWAAEDETRLLLVWAAPFLLFYGLIFIWKVGYCIACLPPLLLWGTRGVTLGLQQARQNGTARFWLIVLFCVVVNVSVFFFVPRAPAPRAGVASTRVSRLLPEALNRTILCCGYQGLRHDQSEEKAYLGRMQKILSTGGCAVVFIQREPSECLNFRVLEYYLPGVPVYAVAGLSEPAPGVHRPLFVWMGESADKSAPKFAAQGLEPTLILRVATKRVLLLYSKQLFVAVSAKGGSARNALNNDLKGSFDAYELYQLSLTPGSSVEVALGRHTLLVVE
jgi:4-amino-4-deoxy-L-arabinose transferase-like glycosyltransferase